MTKANVLKRDIYKIDASGIPLGRLASDIAHHLIGKHKPSFQKHLDVGDLVEVTNLKKVVITGKKYEQSELIRHSSHPGGIKRPKVRAVFEKDPAIVLKHAVSKMLPKNKHRTERMKRLTIIR